MNLAIEEATAAINAARHIAAFTGAGMSAESGIPTYRGDGGLWKSYDPNKYANIDYFFEDPSYYWNFFRDVRYRALVASTPNKGHLALAELECLGKLKTVITQNIDGLHQAAGNTDVIELHGNTKEIGCLECDEVYNYEEIHQKLTTQMPPLCDKCKGMLKPRVVFFGEPLPPHAIERANEIAATCDVLLVVGSTLGVYPAASIPIIAKSGGASVILINLGSTEMDDIADVRLDGKAGEILPLLIGD